MGVLDPLEDLLGGNDDEGDQMAQAATEYQACKQAVAEARRSWAEAERSWAETVSPANLTGDTSLAADMQAAYEAMQFAKCCVIAAGEAFKGETFEAVMARHEGGV